MPSFTGQLGELNAQPGNIQLGVLFWMPPRITVAVGDTLAGSDFSPGFQHVYTAGNAVRVLASFQDPAGAFYTPLDVTVSVIGPASNVVQTPAVVQDGVGQFHADVVATDAGAWVYRVVSGSPVAAAEGSFAIKPSPFVA